MADKLRIAQLVGNAELGGVSNCIYNYFRAIDKSRFEFDFITYGPSALDEKILAEGGSVHYVPDFRNFPAACREWKKLLKTENYDIVHSGLTSLSAFPLYCAKRAGIGARICHAHSTTDGKELISAVKNVLKKPAAQYATELFACGEKAAEWAFGKRKDDAFILPNAVDLKRFSFDEKHRESVRSQLDINGFCMGYAGRFCYQKNLIFFLQVAKELQKTIPSTALLIGGGQDKDELKKFAEENSVNAIFLDGTDRIEEYYSAFDCLCLTSRYEGLPMVGVECLANGLPCYFSDAVTTELACEKTKYLPIDDPVLWAREIVNSAENKDREAPFIITEKFDVNVTVKRLESEYLRIAGRV